QTPGRTPGHVNNWTEGLQDRQTLGQTDTWTCEQLDRRTPGHVSNWTDGHRDRRTPG
ncbi:hypothetical protein N311_09059, partial [Apaloderma vittatum]